MKRKPYPTDLSDAQWAKLKPHLPKAHDRGAPRRVNLRAVINALRYLARSGCQWRLLPHDLPPREVVYYLCWLKIPSEPDSPPRRRCIE